MPLPIQVMGKISSILFAEIKCRSAKSRSSPFLSDAARCALRPGSTGVSDDDWPGTGTVPEEPRPTPIPDESEVELEFLPLLFA